MSDKKNRSTIKIGIELDENRVPENIRWSAPDGGVDAAEAKAMMVSMWDSFLSPDTSFYGRHLSSCD